MTVSNENIDSLKLKLSSALKNKLLKDNEGLALRNREFLYSEELLVVKTEINFTVDQLKNLKSQIHVARHQISLVEICATSEKSKIDTHVTDLTRHKEQFDDIFKKVNHLSELRKRELTQNEEELKNFRREKEKQIVEKMELLQRETTAIEKECDNIERECVVLKKRNNAIMLKLRRKLVETENIRKELMTKNIGK